MTKVVDVLENEVVEAQAGEPKKKGKKEKEKEEKTLAPNKIYWIPLKRITNAEIPNYRNPVNVAILKDGFGVFDRLEGSNKPSLWELALSEKAEDKAKFVELVDNYESDNTEENSIKQTAASLLTNGQLQNIKVRETGSGNFTLIDGMRRCLSILYNYCRGLGKPRALGELADVNDLEARYIALNSNRFRKNHNILEEAKQIQEAINVGESHEEVARRLAVSVQTVHNRLKLLKLDPKEQKAIAEGRQKPSKAIASKRKKHAPESSIGRPLPKKDILKWFIELDTEYPNRQKMPLEMQIEMRVLGRVLRLLDEKNYLKTDLTKIVYDGPLPNDLK